MTIKNKFMVNDNSVSVITLNDATALDALPPQVYTVNFHPMFGFSLAITKELLSVPPKIYGDAENRVRKCIVTYTSRPAATGYLLTGDKGTGKSVVMSLLANKSITELGLPVVLVKAAYEGEQFNSFIQSLGEICLVFDEVGKMYKSSVRDDGIHQESLLQLLDGVDKTKRMVIMTENQVMDISEFMLNRPSRIYYHFKYQKLAESSIVDYCKDSNVSEAIIKDIVDLSRRSRIFSFDMLQTIVEEHLRFDEPIETVIEELNVDIRQEYDTQMEVTKIFNTDTKEEYQIAMPSPLVFKPVYGYTFIKYRINDVKGESEGVDIGIVEEALAALDSMNEPPVEDNDEKDKKIRSFHISQDDLVYESAGNLVYEEDGITVVAKEIPRRSYQYFDLF